MKRILYIGNLYSPFQRELFKFLVMYANMYDFIIKPFHYGAINKRKLLAGFVKHFILQNIEYDLVFIEFLADHAFYSSIMNIGKRPIIVRCHRAELYKYTEKYYYRIKYSTLSVDRIICVCNTMKNRLIKLFPWTRKKSLVIYNSVDPYRFKPLRIKHDRSIFVIGSMGNLIPLKRMHILIFIMKKLIEEGYRDVLLKIAGKGFLEGFLRKLIKKYHLEKNIILNGYIPHNMTPYWYNTLDLFILNSSIEGLPTVILEAMSTGLPVIASNVGGIHEALDKKWLYNPQDINRAINLITEIYNLSPDERRQIGKANRVKVLEKFNIRKNTKEILNIFSEYT